MSGLVEYKGLAIIAAFLCLFVLERFHPKSSSAVEPLQRVIKNLMFWPLNIGLSLVIILPVSFFAVQFHFWERPDWLSNSTGLILDLLILDLFIFCWHRAAHEIQFLWKFHEIHHMDEHLDTTSAIRFHFGEIFFSAFARVPLLMLMAIPFSSVIIFETLVLIFTLFHHSNVALPRSFEMYMSKLIITPALHWVHHHAIRQDTDSNYGTIFSFWDRIFKTKSETQRFESMPIGVEGLGDKRFIELLKRPFSNLFQVTLLAAIFSLAIYGTAFAQEDTSGVQHVTPAQAYKLLQENDEIVVLDVRTPKEFKRDHIEGAVNINYYGWGFRSELKALDPTKTYLVHCAAGFRSSWSLKFMKDAGLNHVIHMKDGLDRWRNENLPLIKP